MSYTKLSPSEIRKKIRDLELEIQKAVPLIVEEKAYLERLLATKSVPVSQLYAEFKTALPAIERCLERHGDFKLTRAEMTAEILEGGYVGRDSLKAQDLLRDGFNYQLRRKRLEERGTQKLIGRTPLWVRPK